MGKYIYGVTEETKRKEFSFPGIGGKEVHTIPYQDLSAVVSNSEVVDYLRLPKDRVARVLVAHQKTIERIMGLAYTIIPMRLGTFAQDIGEVKDILAEGYLTIKEIFDKVNNKIEVDVVATWADFASVLKEIGEANDIKQVKAEILSKPGSVSSDDKIKIGVMVKKHLDEKRKKCALQIQTSFKEITESFKLHDLMDDKMIVDLALLIDKAKYKDFERKIQDLNKKYDERLNFRYIGPLPCYSFYTLEVKKLKFEDLDWARKKLGLNEFATKNEIKKAYQAKALCTHPDKNPNVEGIEEEFNNINKASNILLDYCREKGRSFNKEKFEKNAILVKVTQ